MARSVSGAAATVAVARGQARAPLVFTLEGEGGALAAGAGRSVGSGGFGGHLARAEVGWCRRVRSGRVLERVGGGLGRVGLRTPEDVVQLVHVFVVHQVAADVPQPDAVVDAQTRAGRGRQDVVAVWGPVADAGVGGFDGRDLGVVLVDVEDVHLACEVAESRDEHEAAMRREQEGVARAEREVVLGHSAEVENGRFGRHVAVHDAEFFGVGRPRYVVDWTFFVFFFFFVVSITFVNMDSA